MFSDLSSKASAIAFSLLLLGGCGPSIPDAKRFAANCTGWKLSDAKVLFAETTVQGEGMFTPITSPNLYSGADVVVLEMVSSDDFERIIANPPWSRQWEEGRFRKLLDYADLPTGADEILKESFKECLYDLKDGVPKDADQMDGPRHGELVAVSEAQGLILVVRWASD
ncbi:MAG: hypothetical protein AAF394_03890 [Planctomycetota bacterium]